MMMEREKALAPNQQFVSLTPAERLTHQFYEWEVRGRGWYVYECPVILEPPFRPFLFHAVEQTAPVDDARKPALIAAVIDSFLQRRKEPPSIQVLPPAAVASEVEPEIFIDEHPLVALEISVPPAAKVPKEAAERLLISFIHCTYPVSFEVVGIAETIIIQFVCRTPDQAQISQQLRAYFPETVVTERQVERMFDPLAANVIVDFGLSREFMLPMRPHHGFDVDPLISTVGALGDLMSGELGIFQILFEAVRQPWAESVVRAVTDSDGHSFFGDSPEIVASAKEKIAHPLFAAVVRVAARAHTSLREWQIARSLGASLAQFSNPLGNEFIPLSNEGYPEDLHAENIDARRSCRSGMLLNLDELIALVHPPSASVRCSKLRRERKKTKGAPATARGDDLVLGENRHAGRSTNVTLNATQRLRHMHVIGASGTGKSTLLLNLIMQDVAQGRGVAVLDPHGDLIEEILGRIPESRFDDVVLLDPSDEEFPVGFNILSAHSELEKNLLGSDLVAVFQRLSTSWGDQMTSVLGNAVLAFLERPDGGTLIDLRRFLIESAFRQSVLKTVRDPEVVYYWENSFPLLVGKPQGPILTRLDTFLRPKLVRRMIAQKENGLDLSAVMEGSKIFLAKLAQGAIGEENSFLLGSLLVSKFHQLAMSRQQTAATQRKDFYLYIDEFHNFVTPSMAALLSGARKYHLGLIVAHQELQQLHSRNDDVASAIIANAYTRVCFRLGDFDARKLEQGLSCFDAKDLQNLQVGEAIGRIERSEYDFNLRTVPIPRVSDDLAKSRRETIIRLSRARYAVPMEAVDALFTDVRKSVAEPAQPRRNSRYTSSDIVVEGRGVRELRHKALMTPVSRSGEGALLGKGGPQHKYVQDLIRRWAESKGYRATVEKTILDGLGSVDVALEKDGRTIACEISITTDVSHEIGNVQKCLAAGFTVAVLISSDAKVLTAANKIIRTVLSESQRKQVHCFQPEELFAYIEGSIARPSEGKADSGKQEEVMTAKELEGLLQIDVKTIYSYVQKGLIPYVRIQSNVRFVRSEIMHWMEERRFRPKPPKFR